MAYQALNPSAKVMDDARGTEEGSGQRHDRIQHAEANDLTMSLADGDGKEDDAPISMSQKMLSAVSGSVLTSLLVTPLDVVRVRLQSQSHPTPAPAAPRGPSTFPATFSNLPPNLGISACCREVFWVNNNAPYCVAGPNLVSSSATTLGPECAAEEAQKRNFTSTLDGIRKIARHEGPRTLWRGLSPTLVMAAPANVIYFAGYDWLRTSSKSPFNPTRVNDNYAPLLAGSTARVLAAMAVSPIEMFRTRMQAAHHSETAVGHFRETLNGIHEMVRESGYRTLWRGLTLTLWRDVPFSAMYWWGYETGRNVLIDARERRRSMEDFPRDKGLERVRRRSRSREREDHTATLVDSFVAGATSGAVAAFITTPFDVGKTRQQVSRHNGEVPQAGAAIRPEDKSMPRFLWHIFKEQGMSGLFKGWAARCLKVAPACAIMISSYEVGKKMAGGMNERREARRKEI